MSRIRTIKPEFWSSPAVATVDYPTRLLFIAMWNWADDFGRGSANPKELAAFAFPFEDSVDSTEIRRMLDGIRRAFGVVFYTLGGRVLYAIPSWSKHQKVDHRSRPKFPPPEDGQPWNPTPSNDRLDDLVRVPDQQKQSESRKPTESSAEPTEPSAEPTEAPPSSHRTLGAGTGNREQGTGNREQGDSSTLTRAVEPSSTQRDVLSKQLAITNDEPSAPPPRSDNKIAQEMTRAYHDRVPLSSFPAVMKIIKAARACGRYDDDEIRSALDRLAADGRTVTKDALRYELEGFPAPQQPAVNKHDAEIIAFLAGGQR